MTTQDDRQTPARRVTRQRVALQTLLDSTVEFRTAHQLHDDLRAGGASVGLATVYRTLQSMAEDGELDTLRTGDGEVSYRACAEQGHHHHLVCTRCGHTVEIGGSTVESWTNSIAADHGFHEPHHELEVFGVCDNCWGTSAD